MTEKFGLLRLMSKKGCSPDNAACEGFIRPNEKRNVLRQNLAEPPRTQRSNRDIHGSAEGLVDSFPSDF
ncbi:hypothetical protein CDCE8392_1788 [Corynebacterium diphtheriae CDCE 8392]|nr:hypothetical protein CDCE8392_1788 [Corynebacterium diphtheriae CDCE 8392]